MKEPFIFVTNPDEHHYTDQWDGRGVASVAQQGSHAIFAVKVPFIPSFTSDDFTRAIGGESGLARIHIITNRQLRFINDLINSRLLAPNAVSFDLRFIVHPASNPQNMSKIEVVFLGKVFDPNRRKAEELGLKLWRKFISHYPLEDPFNYPFEVVDADDLARYIIPIAPEHISAQNIVEIRKFEDHDPYIGDRSAIGYFPHAFNPNIDPTAFGRFLETLAQQQQVCVASICIQPTALFLDELRTVNQLLSSYGQMYLETQQGGTLTWMQNYRKERFEDIRGTFMPLINERNHLFKIKIQVIGEHYAPDDVLEALGSELIANDKTAEPRRWHRDQPTSNEDAAIARHNFLFLEHRIWGTQDIEPAAQRLRFLVRAGEAVGAFRLPIPPESGYLPGIDVRDEPFVMPHERQTGANRTITLGRILHRGQATQQYYNIPLENFVRHGLIAGSTGTGKTNTCLFLLSQMWKDHRVPFLVMYPIDKPDYRILMADEDIRDDLLIFTVGDEKTSPFHLNPFAVPDGVLLRTHMSLLMRCFSAAFTMWDPLPAIYRAAIRQVYADRGWDVVSGVGGDQGTRIPTVADFYDTLVTTANEMTKDYGREVQGNVRQGSEIRIRDLLLNLGAVVNAEEPAAIGEILKRPTVMELGRIGSSEDTALLMAFLLMQLSEQLQSNLRLIPHHERKKQMHVTLVEEAHRLMPASTGGNADYTADPRSKGGEDFSNLLAEVRGFGEGILIAEQMPTTLVQGAIGNTYLKIMHWLEDQASFRLFCDIMNLDDRQRDYARTLQRGETIVRDVSGRPVHVRVSNYLDKFQTPDDTTIIEDSDEDVHRFMQGRFVIPPSAPWTPPAIQAPTTNASTSHAQIIPELAQWCRSASCEPVMSLPNSALTERVREIAQSAKQQDWQRVAQICTEQLTKYNISVDASAARCFLARVANLKQGTGEHAGKRLYHAFDYYREALSNLPMTS
ncbi:ATP-binding protein [bacterium]|nr:ATP-binding protein [bacterium]